MSLNQSRTERSDSSQNRKPGRSGSFSQWNYSGISGKGGAAAPPPSTLQPNRSLKKSNNAQGGQPRASAIGVKSDSFIASSAQSAQNGSLLQQSVPGAPSVPVSGTTSKLTTDMPLPKSVQVVPKAPTPHPANVKPDNAPPATPSKALGDAAAKPFPIQFGSVSPGTLNGMQIPARTTSAPPNLVEQQRDQARRDSLRQVPVQPIPSVPKQQTPRKEGGASGQLKTSEAHQIPKARRESQVPSVAPVSQNQKAPVHTISGVSMSMPFHQPQVPVQFGGPSPQMQSQGMAGTSLPMPMPLSRGSGPPLQQSMYVSGLHHHPIQAHGMMHQGQSLNFPTQLASQLPPQLGKLGLGVGPQFPHQAGKFVGSRKPVKITHPDTHEELRLDKASGSRPHQSVPQAQPVTSVPPASPMNYCAPNSVFVSAPGPVPLTGTVNPSSQAPRFGFPVNQGSQTSPFLNPSHTSLVNKSSITMHGVSEHSNLDSSHELHKAMPAVASAPVQVTIKPATEVHGEKINDLASSTASVEKVVSQKHLSKRDSEVQPNNSSHQPKPLASAPPASPEVPAPVETQSADNRRKETSARSDSIKDQSKKQTKKGPFQPLRQVPTSVSTLPCESLEHTNMLSSVASETSAIKQTVPSTSDGSSIDSSREPLPMDSVGTGDLTELRTQGDGPLGSRSESFRTSGASVVVDSLAAISASEQNNSPSLGEPLNNEDTGSGVGTVTNGAAKEDDYDSKMPSESALSKCAELINQSEQKSSAKVHANSREVASLEIVHQVLEDPTTNCKKDDSTANNQARPASLVPDTNTSTSTLGSFTSSDGDQNILASDTSASGCDGLDSTLPIVANSSVSNDAVTHVSSIPAPEPILTCEEDGSEDISAGLASLAGACSKETPVPELSMSKSSVAKARLKKKEILRKADAAGAISDLYTAYKGPEEKKETIRTSDGAGCTSANISQESVVEICQDDVHSSEKGRQNEAEPDDWEDAADISTPKLDTADSDNGISGGLRHLDGDGIGLMAKKYTRDFLLTVSEQCTDLPEGFEITSDLSDALMAPNISASRKSYPSPGRVVDRSPGGPRRVIVPSDEDRWSRIPVPLATGHDFRTDGGYGSNFRPGQGGNHGVLRNPRGHIAVQYAGGILSGPMQSPQTGMQRNSSDSDRWQRATGFQKGLIPSPQTPAPVMHKAEKRYQVGEITDEEAAKQRQLKGILNKLTPQNFERLFEQVKAVNIDNAGTLRGVISQIFDKALMEPTFCEMYANFCFHLAGELPDFIEDNEKITFKRLLLNKCQEEFERGEREQEEANRDDMEGEVKQSAEEKEEKRIRVRRRMLGNIRLIGELYKKKMLTERIMHECIKKLLGPYQNPDEEDIEALCKLMSTIGEIIDHPKAKEHMDFYFDMMSKLSNNMRLSSRVRFMLKDAIDLRKNKWQQRRKVEGPKKIEEVHRDAAQERQVQVGRLARGPGPSSSVRNRQPMDFGSRGSSMLSSSNTGGFRGLPAQPRGFGVQDARVDERHSFESRTPSVPLPQRPLGEESITLGPQGGLARGMSIRGQPSMSNMPFAEAPSPGDSRRMPNSLNGGFSSGTDRTVHGSREDPMPRYNMQERFSSPYDQAAPPDRNMSYGNRDLRMPSDRTGNRSRPGSPNVVGGGLIPSQHGSSGKVWPEERLREMSLAAIKEFYSARDEKEVALCVKDLNAPSFYPTMISLWVSESFDRKDMERDSLAKLLTNLSKSQDSLLNHDHLIKGFESVLSTLEDTVNDAPKAGEFLGRIFAKIVIEDVIPFSEIGQLIYEGGEEQGSLVEGGLAAEVVGTMLDLMKSIKGEPFLNELRRSSSLKLEKFRPLNWKKPLRLDKFI